MSSSAESIAKTVNLGATGQLTEEDLEESAEKDLSEAITRARADRTIEVPLSKRRLDSFARLLASQSLCVAVTVFKGTIHITANELKKTSKDNNAQITSMKKIAEYFSELAGTTSSSSSSSQLSSTEKIFIEICSPKHLNILLKGSLHIQDEIIKEVAVDVLNHSQKPTIDPYNYFYKKGKDVMLAGLAYGEFTKLHRDFKKLITTLTKTNENNDEFEDTNDEILELRTAFNKKPIILKEEPETGIHAEVQLLSHIIKAYTDTNESEKKDFPKSIYIGISKLCCLQCRHMVSVKLTTPRT